MSVQNSTTLKSYFQTGDQPTQAQFGDTIDTMFLGTPLAGGTSSGAANVYNFSVDSDLTSLAVGQQFSIIAHQTNSAGCTASINGITPLSITKNGGTALAAGDITLGAAMLLYYDGGHLQLVNPSISTSTGTVSSVALSMPPDLFAVAGTPITSSGTLAVTKANQTTNTVLAGPTTGVAAAPTMRALVAADLPAATTAAQGAVQLATAAVTKTAADTTMPAAVGTLANHPGVAKAWVSFTGSTGAVLASYNVASVTRTSTGLYTIVFTTGFADANYAVVGVPRITGGAVSLLDVPVATAPTTAQCVIECRASNPGTLTDPTSAYVAFFGNF